MEDDARDFATDEHYCQHGTYIGSWCGPDYMCQWCEDGVSVDEMNAIRRSIAISAANDRLGMVENVCHVCFGAPYSSAVATAITIWAIEMAEPALETLRRLEAA